jgi:hypothetical protein
LLCAAADSSRRHVHEGQGQTSEGAQGGAGASPEDASESEGPSEGPGLSLGDMPQEVLLHVVGLAAVPLSHWIGVPVSSGFGTDSVPPVL